MRNFAENLNLSKRVLPTVSNSTLDNRRGRELLPQETQTETVNI